jgi:phosphopantothenoylcysteine synthetase/decarboxylase
VTRKLLYVVVCGAGPATHVDRLVTIAHERDWDVQIIATPAGVDFIDVAALEAQTGNQVRSNYRKPGEPRSKPADAIMVAPATYNTINKLALGISDTYALGVLAEAIGLGLPIVILPFLNSALALRQPLLRSIEQLRSEGVQVYFGQGMIEPHEPHTGDTVIGQFPWTAGFDSLA